MSYTKRNTRVSGANFATNFDISDTALNTFVSAQLQQRVANDQTPTELADLPAKSVSFDLLNGFVATGSYTAAGKTVNGVQLAALIRQVVLDEATRQGI